MKIKSNANSSFQIDGITIYPGARNYKKLDASKREVRYQLGILKADGVLEFNELIKTDIKKLPFVKEEKKKEVAKEAKQPAKKAKKKDK